MNFPDENQWDETTCQEIACQHPQCWAALRRIERGHPRILGTPCKTLEIEEKLPVLSIVNISDSCLMANKLARHHLSGHTFTKARSLLSRCSKFHPKFKGRSHKDFPDKYSENRTEILPQISQTLKKLPVLNLHETKLPYSYDTRNMTVVWIPEEQDNHEKPAKKQPCVPSQVEKKKKNKFAMRTKASQVLSREEHTKAQSKTPVVTVPPPTPVCLLEQQPSKLENLWNQSTTLPQDLIKELLTDDGKINMPCPEVKIQLSMMKETLPLEKSQPGSEISAKMFLSIHRITLQSPALRYPEYVKKLSCNLKTGAHRKFQHWRSKQQKTMAPKKQDAKKKTKSKSLRPMTSDVSISSQSQINQQHGIKGQKRFQKVKIQDSTERLKMDLFDKRLNSFSRKKSVILGRKETTIKNASTLKHVVLQFHEKSLTDPSIHTSAISWNPELRLLRILQDSDDEDEEDLSSDTEFENNGDSEEEDITDESYFESLLTDTGQKGTKG